MDTKFKDSEVKNKKEKMIKKIVLFVLSSIALIIVAICSITVFNDDYRYMTAKGYLLDEDFKSEANKEVDLVTEMVISQAYKDNESEFVKGINLAKEQLDNGEMKEKVYKTMFENTMLDFIEELKVYLSEENILKFEILLEENKEKYNKEAEDKYKEQINYIYEAIIPLISVESESNVIDSIKVERNKKLKEHDIVLENLEIEMKKNKEFLELADEIIENKGEVEKNSIFTYAININADADGYEYPTRINSYNYGANTKMYDIQIDKDVVGPTYIDIKGKEFNGMYNSDIKSLENTGKMVKKLYGEYATIKIFVDKEILFSKDFSTAYIEKIEEAESNLIGTNEVLVGLGLVTILLIAIFMKFSKSPFMFIHRKTPVLINIGVFTGALILLTMLFTRTLYIRDIILPYTILLTIILCIEYIMLITDIAYVIDYGFKRRYAVDIWILKKINIFRFLKFNGTNNIEKMKNIKSKSPEFVKGMGGKASNLVSEIKADKDKSERVYKFATISGFIGMALATVFGGFLILVSGIPLIFILIAISIGGLIIVVYTYMYIKIEQLKYDIKGIEKATSRIVDGDFNINFETSEVRELDIIRENILSIDKGFKIAIEDELKSERMKAELITNVSHDLKTPLTSIINYVDLLQMVGVSEEDRTEYLKILDNKSKRLKVLIEDLFEASKATTGNIKLNIENIDVVSVLRQTFAEFKEKIDDSTLDFKINIPDHKVKLDLDGARMWRVFENLIGNALKYSMEESRVYLDLKDLEDKVVFEIKNISGYELNCDPIELKERFKRADESRTMEGSGLGLSIANGLIEAQGGKLDIFIDGDLFKVVIMFEK